MSDGMPDEPMTPMGEAMAMAHMMFDGLMEVGFSKDEALRLLAYYLVELGSRGDGGGGK